MRLGTIIELPDGRVGTVVFNSLIGVGIKWGEHKPDPSDFEGTTGGVVAMLGGAEDEVPTDFEWEPDALLREPWEGFERHGFKLEDCVGEEYTIIREGYGK